MSEPRWMTEARKYVGQKEIAGRRNNPLIIRWWTLIRAPFSDDETPWCGAFTGGVLAACNIDPPKAAWYALNWAAWGMPLHRPVVGAITVFRRKGGGHVGFYTGKNNVGAPIILGGNQGDMVSIKSIGLEVVGYRWPIGEAVVDSDPTWNIGSEVKVT